MSISSDSAEQVMKIMLEGEEICLKATGKAAIEILKYVAVFLKSHQQTQGKTKLINLVKSGKQLDFFGVKKEDLPIFMKEAKRYGILYSALVDKKNKNGNVDIIVKSEDSSRVNRIVKKCRIATVVDEGELKAEITKAREEKQNSKVPDAKEIGVEQKDLEAKFAQLGAAYGLKPQDLIKQLGQNPEILASISQQAMNDKVKEFLMENNKVEIK